MTQVHTSNQLTANRKHKDPEFFQFLILICSRLGHTDYKFRYTNCMGMKMKIDRTREKMCMNFEMKLEQVYKVAKRQRVRGKGLSKTYTLIKDV